MNEKDNNRKGRMSTFVDAKFSFNGTHHFKGGLKHKGINITMTPSDVTEEELKQLIVEALQWADCELNTQVTPNGTPIYTYDYILASISY